MLIERIRRQFQESAELQSAAFDALGTPIAAAIDAMFAALANGGRIFACGNGSSASDAQRFASALIGRFERERPGLPALALSASPMASGAANDPDQLFAQQVRALGHAGDVLLAIVPEGPAPNVLAAIDEAHAREMVVVALTGDGAAGGAVIAQALSDMDIQIGVPAQRVARIHELHLLTIHCLCDGIDAMLLGDD
jgi:D-sedoheptulose 7-phosphate isomerase